MQVWIPKVGLEYVVTPVCQLEPDVGWDNTAGTMLDACSVALRRSVLQTTLSEQQRPTTGHGLEDTRPGDANINVLSQFAQPSTNR